jgi:hypothetical protein
LAAYPPRPDVLDGRKGNCRECETVRLHHRYLGEAQARKAAALWALRRRADEVALVGEVEGFLIEEATMPRGGSKPGEGRHVAMVAAAAVAGRQRVQERLATGRWHCPGCDRDLAISEFHRAAKPPSAGRSRALTWPWLNRLMSPTSCPTGGLAERTWSQPMARPQWWSSRDRRLAGSIGSRMGYQASGDQADRRGTRPALLRLRPPMLAVSRYARRHR